MSAIDFNELRQQLLSLHQRELDGLLAFESAVSRAQQFGLTLNITGTPAPVRLALPTGLPPARELPAPPIRPKRGKVAKAAKVKTVRAGSGRQPTAESVKVRAWIELRAGAFTLDDMPASVLFDRQKVGKLLSYLANNGKLKRVAHGRYEVPAQAAPPAETSIAPKYNPTANGAPVLDGKMLRDRAAQAALYCVGLNDGKSLSARQIIDMSAKFIPHLKLSETDFRVALIDAAQAGLLTRIGHGHDAVYTTTPK